MATSQQTAPVKSRRLRNALIAAQVAVSLVLMIAGSELIRSPVRAVKMETGYDGKHVVQLVISFPEAPSYTAARRSALMRELRLRLAGLPGVAAITAARAPDDHHSRPLGFQCM